MALDKLFSQDLKEYILNTTSPEHPLLEALRKETFATSNAPQMLSGPVEGQLLKMLVGISGAKTCLELGTFTGYSALHIAQALPEDGKLITCEINPKDAQTAQKYFDQSPHGHKIEIRLGEALQTIAQLTMDFDFIFIDADKGNYPLYYDQLIPKLAQGKLMVVDNALWDGKVTHPQDAQSSAIDALNQKAHHDPRVETVMLSVRDGILLIRKII
jgi:caffeoyl-CoA O-methyltransferase